MAIYATALDPPFLRHFFVSLTLLMRGMGTRRAPAITEDSTINDVCKWAGLPRSAGGVGLSVPSVAILRREEITGTSLFEMSAAELRSVGLTSGAHTDLLAAITRLREPQGAKTVAPHRNTTTPPPTSHHIPLHFVQPSCKPQCLSSPAFRGTTKSPRRITPRCERGCCCAIPRG